MSNVPRILDRVPQGDPRGCGAAEELLPLVYEELRKLAAHTLAREAPGQTLQPTVLVHDARLRLTGKDARRRWSECHRLETSHLGWGL